MPQQSYASVFYELSASTVHITSTAQQTFMAEKVQARRPTLKRRVIVFKFWDTCMGQQMKAWNWLVQLMIKRVACVSDDAQNHCPRSWQRAFQQHLNLCTLLELEIPQLLAPDLLAHVYQLYHFWVHNRGLKLSTNFLVAYVKWNSGTWAAHDACEAVPNQPEDSPACEQAQLGPAQTTLPPVLKVKSSP